MRSAMANSQNRPAMTKATPTAAEPMSLTWPICGSWSVVSRSASFSIAVLSNSTTSTRTTTAISSTRRIVVAPTSQAIGSESASAASSSRTACSERMAKARPLRVLMVARQNRSNSKSRRDRHRLHLAAAFLLEQFRDQESHVDRLLGVEAGIADRVIAIVEILIGDGARAAGAFGDVLPGHFQVHATGMRSLRRVDGEERLHLRQYPVERTGLVTAVRSDGVAVHRIARPDHHMTFALNGADQLRQMIADLVRPEAVDQRQASGLVVGIEHLDQSQQFVRLERGPAFQTDRILDAAEIFDMAVIELPGTVTDPDHVTRCRVPVAGRGIDPRESLLVAEQQRLVAGIDIGGAQLGVAFQIETAGPHEIQRVRNAVRQLLVTAGVLGILQETKHPLMHAAKIGEAAGRKCAQQIQRRRRLAIRHQLALRIGGARPRRERDIVDDVAAVARQFDVADLLRRRRARFCKLSGDAADLYHRQRAGIG